MKAWQRLILVIAADVALVAVLVVGARLGLQYVRKMDRSLAAA